PRRNSKLRRSHSPYIFFKVQSILVPGVGVGETKLTPEQVTALDFR
ncbi:MAG: hypothetical protein ACI9HK_003605, partial [Pirellulaceae bacterium]